MHILYLLLLLLVASPGQSPGETSKAQKIQTILQIQDQRLGTDPRLAGITKDGDPIIRERAALACASIQDTNLIPLLLPLLTDSSSAVEEAASFAIGQTGVLLSSPARQSLEEECLRIVHGGKFCPRLLEEVGKFGSAQLLTRLVEWGADKPVTPYRDALVMGIARFAIRGIAADAATQYLLNLARSSSNVSWEVPYALQRFPLLERAAAPVILPLLKHPDPLVRMYVATALGKIGDTLGCGTALLALTREDPDWRVRVNALKALGTFGRPIARPLVDGVAACFSDSNEHVALAAMTAFGEMFKGLGQIPAQSEHRLWAIARAGTAQISPRRRAEAFTALAKIRTPGVFKRLSSIRPPDDWVRTRLVGAFGLTGDTLALTHLVKSVDHVNALVATSALEGLDHLGALNPRDMHLRGVIASTAVQALGRKDLAVISTAATLLEDSLYRSSNAVPELIRALPGLREPDDVEALQQVIRTLGVLRDDRASEALRQKLASTDRTVAEAAAEALQSITGRSYHSEIHTGINVANSSADSAFLFQLPDTVLVRMQTSQGSVDLELYTRIAPYTVMSFLKLARKGFFDGLRFHRVVPNFVVQGGDPRGDGWGGPAYSIRSEFSLLRYQRGMLGMASAGKDTEGSQFFITHSPQPHLDGRYTIFGMVRKGMDAVDRLQVGDRITTVIPLSHQDTSSQTRSYQ
jgi:cyclophilin family peptidyl-prolyl cis-trans isomerase/HEAT repeat protein